MTAHQRKPKIVRRLGIAAILLTLAAPAVALDNYPSRTVKIVVPVPPGVVLDTVPRMIAEKLAIKWGRPVVIENRPGAATNIGTEAVSKAEPDGYTLLAAPSSPLVVNQFLYSRLGFDPAAFVPVTQSIRTPYGIVLNPNIQVSSLAEFIAYARANPDKITYGSPGLGTMMQLAVAKLMSAAGIRLVHVPYQGMAPAMRDLLAGHIDMTIDLLGNAVPQVKEAKLKMLAVTSANRNPALPDVPAMSETVPGYALEDWFTIVAPPKTPSDIAAKLAADIGEALKAPDIAKRLDDLFVVPDASTPAETAAMIARERERWRRDIDALGIKVE
jgi:tripartite-type tricarboxylate transporter receptor subunit TctC